MDERVSAEKKEFFPCIATGVGFFLKTFLGDYPMAAYACRGPVLYIILSRFLSLVLASFLCVRELGFFILR